MPDWASKTVVIVSLFVVLIIGLVILLPVADTIDTYTETQGGGAPTTSTFTSTADFDAGTKAPTTGGNLGVESNTDNLGIAAGSFELGSLKGDSFTTVDADAETAKWDLVSGVSVGCGTVTRTIAAGVLSISVQSGAVGCRRGVRSAVTVTGDWDIRIKVDTTTSSGATNLFELSILNQALVYCTDGGTVDGLLYQDTLSATHALDAFTCVNGAFAAVGAQTGGLADPRWLRFTRATNTFTWYYSADGSAWTQDEQTTNANIGNPVYVLLNIFSASALDGTTAADLDDYHLATGTVSAGGYRTIGNWTSIAQSSSGIQAEITLTYSGASAQGYIDFVALYDGATRFAFDDTDVIAGGPTVSYIFVVTVPTGWTVRVGLAGDGSATTNIAQVEVAVTPGSVAAPLSGTNALIAQTIPLFYAIAIILIAVVVIKWWGDGE